jgi:hypothetical protein
MKISKIMTVVVGLFVMQNAYSMSMLQSLASKIDLNKVKSVGTDLFNKAVAVSQTPGGSAAVSKATGVIRSQSIGGKNIGSLADQAKQYGQMAFSAAQGFIPQSMMDKINQIPGISLLKPEEKAAVATEIAADVTANLGAEVSTQAAAEAPAAAAAASSGAPAANGLTPADIQAAKDAAKAAVAISDQARQTSAANIAKLKAGIFRG